MDPTPLFDLPTELWREILLLAMNLRTLGGFVERDVVIDAISLGSVCHHWQAIIHSIHPIWDYVQVSDKHFDILLLLKNRLENPSKPATLFLDITNASPLYLTQRIASRIAYLWLHHKMPPYISDIFLALDSSHLYRLYISGRTGENDRSPLEILTSCPEVVLWTPWWYIFGGKDCSQANDWSERFYDGFSLVYNEEVPVEDEVGDDEAPLENTYMGVLLSNHNARPETHIHISELSHVDAASIIKLHGKNHNSMESISLHRIMTPTSFDWETQAQETIRVFPTPLMYLSLVDCSFAVPLMVVNHWCDASLNSLLTFRWEHTAHTEERVVNNLNGMNDHDGMFTYMASVCSTGFALMLLLTELVCLVWPDSKP